MAKKQSTPKELRERTVKTAGMSYTKKDGYILVGYDRSGRAVYSDKKLAMSNNLKAGQEKVDFLGSVFRTLGAANDADSTTLDYIGAASSDVAFMGQLYAMKEAGDTKGFVNSVMQRLKIPITQAAFKDPQNRAGARAAFQAWNLYNNWDRMSNAQRGLGVAQVGLDAFRFADGSGIANKPLFEAIKVDGKTVVPGLNMGQALNLMASGVDIYSTAKNWKDMSTLARIGGGAQTVSNVINMAQALGYTTTAASAGGAAAAGAAAGSAAGAGAGAAAGAGGAAAGSAAGAGAGAAGSTAAAGSSTLASVGSAASVVGGAAGIALGTKAIIDGWGKSGSAEGRKQGAMAGAAAGIGAIALAGGPVGWIAAGAFVAAGLLSGSVKAGKHKHQKERDGIRGYLKDTVKLLDDNYKITLPDGTIADLGIDGSGGKHKWKDQSKVGDNPYAREELASYDVDYTNDLDYASSMAGISLARILSGGSGRPIDQIGGQLSNAALGKVGYGADFTEENFAAVMQNHRAVYAKAGIKSIEDMNQLISEMEKNGRMTSAEATAARQAGNLLYGEKSYDTAKQLMSGRWRGIEVQQEIDKGEEQAEMAKMPKPDSSSPSMASPAKPGVPVTDGTPSIKFETPGVPKDENLEIVYDESGYGRYQRKDGSNGPVPLILFVKPGSEAQQQMKDRLGNMDDAWVKGAPDPSEPQGDPITQGAE